MITLQEEATIRQLTSQIQVQADDILRRTLKGCCMCAEELCVSLVAANAPVALVDNIMSALTNLINNVVDGTFTMDESTAYNAAMNAGWDYLHPKCSEVSIHA